MTSILDTARRLKQLSEKAYKTPWKNDFCGEIWTESEPGTNEHELYKTILNTRFGPGEELASFVCEMRNHIDSLCDAVIECERTIGNLIRNIHSADCYESLFECCGHEYEEASDAARETLAKLRGEK